jgi:MFS family permease
MGRRASMRLGSFLCFVSTLFQVFAPNIGVFVAGRCIQGLGVGFLSMTVPIIQAEIAPGHARGVFIVVENFFLNAG